jgi:hypothetical protein
MKQEKNFKIGSKEFWDDITKRVHEARKKIDLNKIEIKEIVKYKGIWEIHKNDKDIFPSNPHAHNKKNGLKLNLDNGELYNPQTKKIEEKMSKKDLELLKSKFNILNQQNF